MGIKLGISSYFLYMSQRTTKPTLRLVRPAKTQISLRIRTVWSESSLIACAFYSPQVIKKWTRALALLGRFTGWCEYFLVTQVLL